LKVIFETLFNATDATQIVFSSALDSKPVTIQSGLFDARMEAGIGEK
jgi:hypothetical protein